MSYAFVTMSQKKGSKRNLIQEKDEDLMILYQRADPPESEAAFLELYKRHSPRVYGFLKSKSIGFSSGAIADEAFQATWLKLHTFKDRYDPKFPFLPWLFTISRNALTDEIRKISRSREIPTEQETLVRVPEVLTEMSTPTAHIRSQTLKGLPENTQTALHLRYDLELSFEEIAQKLHTSPSNVRQWISRGIRKIRSQKKKGTEQQ